MTEELFLKKKLFYKETKTEYLIAADRTMHSKKEIAEVIGISYRYMLETIKKRESGAPQHTMLSWSLENVCRLAEYLGYTVEELLQEKPMKEIKDEAKNELEEILRRRENGAEHK